MILLSMKKIPRNLQKIHRTNKEVWQGHRILDKHSKISCSPIYWQQTNGHTYKLENHITIAGKAEIFMYKSNETCIGLIHLKLYNADERNQ